MKFPKPFKNKVDDLIIQFRALLDIPIEPDIKEDRVVVATLLATLTNAKDFIPSIESYSSIEPLIRYIKLTTLVPGTITYKIRTNLRSLQNQILDDEKKSFLIKGPRSLQAILICAEFLDTIKKWRIYYPLEQPIDTSDFMHYIEKFSVICNFLVSKSFTDEVNNTIKNFFLKLDMAKKTSPNKNKIKLMQSFLLPMLAKLPASLIHPTSYEFYKKNELQVEINNLTNKKTHYTLYQYLTDFSQSIEAKRLTALIYPNHNAQFIIKVINKFASVAASNFNQVPALKTRALAIIKIISPYLSDDNKTYLRRYFRTTDNFIREHQKFRSWRCSPFGDTQTWQEIDRCLTNPAGLCKRIHNFFSEHRTTPGQRQTRIPHSTFIPK